MRWSRGWALLLALAGPLRAAPPDARLALAPGHPRIERVDDGFTAVEVDAPALLGAELLPSGELLLEPRAAGEAHVFLFARRLVRVIEVAVGRPLPQAVPAPSGSCAAPQITAACYAPWRERLLHLAAAEAPRLSFELEGLQAEARAAQALLAAAGLSQLLFSRSSLGVQLKGAQSDVALRAGLRAVWPAILGPLRVDR